MLDKGVWELTEKNLPVPEVSDSVTQDVITAFKVRQNQVLSIIYLNIEIEYKRILDNCSSPVEA